MAKLKGLRITREVKGTFKVVPLFHAKKGGTMKAGFLASAADNLVDAIGAVLLKLVARGHLKE